MNLGNVPMENSTPLIRRWCTGRTKLHPAELVKSYLLLMVAPLLIAVIGYPAIVLGATTDEDVARVVVRHVSELPLSNGAGGTAIVIRIDGRSLFFNYGFADFANNKPVTSDSL